MTLSRVFFGRTEIHDVIAADSAVVYHDVPSPECNGVPLFEVSLNARMFNRKLTDIPSSLRIASCCHYRLRLLRRPWRPLPLALGHLSFLRPPWCLMWIRSECDLGPWRGRVRAVVHENAEGWRCLELRLESARSGCGFIFLARRTDNTSGDCGGVEGSDARLWAVASGRLHRHTTSSPQLHSGAPRRD
jgi:hypothetical protein